MKIAVDYHSEKLVFCTMFTGIIEATGTITEVLETGSNRSFWIRSSISNELKIDQSLAHDGVCLTVDALKEDEHRVTAVKETLSKTNLSTWAPSRLINLERSMLMNGRLDGHLVQGHVDTTGICEIVKEEAGSWLYTFSFPQEFANLLVEKGSASINGTSLTVFNVQQNSFSVAIIPYTYQYTNIHQLQPGSPVNLEFDIIGKYVLRNTQLQ
ncbi:riboflavin synthase [Lacibacter luteus]|nr:riboflavin synthase [Lacibacter luteus]